VDHQKHERDAMDATRSKQGGERLSNTSKSVLSFLRIALITHFIACPAVFLFRDGLAATKGVMDVAACINGKKPGNKIS
jgi:hypothetical protein